MKKLTVLSMILLAALLVFTGCEEAGTDLNVDGMMYISGDGQEWNSDNAAAATYWRTGPFSEINYSAWDGQATQAAFEVVSYVDPADSPRSKFLKVSQRYGATEWMWRVYGTDEGFAADDTVTVSVDVWVPDLTAATSSGCWVEIYIAGKPTGPDLTDLKDLTLDANSDTIPDNDLDEDGNCDHLVQKYDANWGAQVLPTGSGGWVTFTKDVVVDSNGVISVGAATGLASTPDGAVVVYFDNLAITNVVTP